jgi:hypothetical protein
VAAAGADLAGMFHRICKPPRDAAKGLSSDSCRPRPSAWGTSPGSGPRLKPKPKNRKKS